MPEIVNRERILEKLRQFDEKLSGASIAMDIIQRLQNDARSLIAAVREDKKDIETIHENIQQIQDIWEELESDILETQERLETSNQELQEQFNSITEELENRVQEAVRELNMANSESRLKHSQYAKESHFHAESTARDKDKVVRLAEEVNQQLNLCKKDLYVVIEQRLAQNESNTESWLTRVDGEWKEKIEALRQSVQNGMTTFQDDFRKNLVTHQQGVDSHLTEFLAKQNILVQNLAQQIDGFHRTTKTLSDNQQDLTIKMEILVKEMMHKISEQETTTGALQEEIHGINKKLEQLVKVLEEIPIYGKKFKNLL